MKQGVPVGATAFVGRRVGHASRSNMIPTEYESNRSGRLRVQMNGDNAAATGSTGGIGVLSVSAATQTFRDTFAKSDSLSPCHVNHQLQKRTCEVVARITWHSRRHKWDGINGKSKDSPHGDVWWQALNRNAGYTNHCSPCCDARNQYKSNASTKYLIRSINA